MKILAIFLLFLGIGIWWETYKFKDCKKVGHSSLYCVGRIGN